MYEIQERDVKDFFWYFGKILQGARFVVGLVFGILIALGIIIALLIMN